MRLILNTAMLALLAASAVWAGDFKEEALGRIDTLEKKYTGLAEAMPQSAYEWRPMEGVRSVSELFLHITGANYGLTRFIGTPPPEGFSFQGFQNSTTKKSEITPQVKKSFAHLRAAVEKMDVSKKEEPVKMFGGTTTQRGAVLNLLEHLSEHLGQSIAYARTNKVVPPWSAGN